jgi:FAD/FMN-containing dehydrogenase
MITSTIELAGLDGGLVSFAPEELDDLRARMEGRILSAGDDGWESAVLIWNAMAANVPGIVVQPVSARDVVAATQFAGQHRVLLSIKGGGHNIAGTSIAAQGLTLDLTRLREVKVDRKRRLAHVGAGCQLRDVDRATQEHGLATVLGFISEVGVAGLTLGGGLGYLTRRFGWSVDNLEEVEIVTADGRIRRASRAENADLFWAVRGGGGNFGVITRFTYRLHSVGPTVYGGLVAWSFEQADDFLRAYRTLTTESPRELTAFCEFLCAPPAPFVPEDWVGKPVCGMLVCYTGDPGQAEEALAPMRVLGDPLVNLLRPQPYTEVQSYLDAIEPKGRHYYWKSNFLAELSDGMLTAMRELYADRPTQGLQIGVLQLGGALNERAWDDGAIGNRDARYVWGVKGDWGPDEPDPAGNRKWIRAAAERLHPFSTGGNYINFQTADEDETRVRETYGRNFDRLVEIKRRYDPENLFRANRNIRPSL